ncbi:predicted protein [Sclerotinia sclerotiorum 1980 UF-70]|uniref:Uncharacterized protein n=1 Tax=Sclerotinia sclerotiorum (strain ATCC 18683 / 1980 / Ss-1) TaxID=665079 RepID=A7EXW8_SCLS1|nr:predicted protein [Sclerotinia sclerotiorum 1980 UF-70]EDN94310.1 predicted protein [Sclerotinia sclerotiorum 1980 UF-70]
MSQICQSLAQTNVSMNINTMAIAVAVVSKPDAYAALCGKLSTLAWEAFSVKCGNHENGENLRRLSQFQLSLTVVQSFDILEINNPINFSYLWHWNHESMKVRNAHKLHQDRPEKLRERLLATPSVPLHCNVVGPCRWCFHDSNLWGCGCTRFVPVTVHTKHHQIMLFTSCHCEVVHASEYSDDQFNGMHF